MFETLGYLASSILDEISSDRVAARKEVLVIKSAQKRRIDESLLTENYDQYWSARIQGEERTRQAYLLERSRRVNRSAR